jgi:hypothetical protein
LALQRVLLAEEDRELVVELLDKPLRLESVFAEAQQLAVQLIHLCRKPCGLAAEARARA